MMSSPKFSIVTIARNEEKTIRFTLDSFRKQQFSDFECIIIDGSSSDRTPDIAKEYSKQDSRFVFQTQKSTGISSAFNEGIALARAPFLVFINAGDSLHNANSLSLVYEKIMIQPDSIHCFRGEYATEFGIGDGHIFPRTIPRVGDLEFSCVIAHQSTYIPRAVFERLGGYSVSFRIAMDYEFWLRAWQSGLGFHWYEDVTSLHRRGGISQTLIGQSRAEVVAARLIHLNRRRPSLVKDIMRIILSIRK